LIFPYWVLSISYWYILVNWTFFLWCQSHIININKLITLIVKSISISGFVLTFTIRTGIRSKCLSCLPWLTISTRRCTATFLIFSNRTELLLQARCCFLVKYNWTNHDNTFFFIYLISPVSMDEDVSVSLLFLSTLLSIFFQFSVVKEHTEMTLQCLASSVLLENILSFDKVNVWIYRFVSSKINYFE
jgi:hypothetical protein